MCSMRSDQMFANVCSDAQSESVRQKVITASIHKIVQRRQQRDAKYYIEEVVFHW
jgi:UDP-N-acetyl-D-mannosaminuronic acid transferase (WecB/TagA/CpsF family)